MEPNYQVKSVTKALSILKCFDAQNKEMSLTDLTLQTGFHKTSVYRLLMNLIEQGFMQMTLDGKYTVGGEIRRLGYLWDGSESLKRKASPVLKQLHEQTGETVFLVEYEHGRAVCTDRIETNKTLKITSQIGSWVPLFKGATGKSIAAFLQDWELKLALRIQQEIFNEDYDLELLQQEFRTIRQNHSVLTTGELDEGVTAFAVPLLNRQQKVAGSISIAGPSFRFRQEVIERYQQGMVDMMNGVNW